MVSGVYAYVCVCVLAAWDEALAHRIISILDLNGGLDTEKRLFLLRHVKCLTSPSVYMCVCVWVCACVFVCVCACVPASV